MWDYHIVVIVLCTYMCMRRLSMCVYVYVTIGRLPIIAHCVPIVHYKVVVMDGVSKVTV